MVRLVNVDLNSVAPTTSNRIRIADVLSEIDFEEESISEEFNYMESITNRDGLNRMFEERRVEREEKEKKISERINDIKKDEIKIEVEKIWKISGKIRTRISKNDREKAIKIISKRIREEEDANLHLNYLKRHKPNENNL